MNCKFTICTAAALAILSASAGLRRLAPVTVVEGASVDIRTDNASSLKSSNTSIATVSLPNGGASVVSGLKLGSAEITFTDARGPFAVQPVTVVPSYWETIQRFFEDDPEVSVSVSGDKVIVSGRTSSSETIRRVEQSKAFDPNRIISQVTYSAPAIATILQQYLHQVGYTTVNAAAVGNEICLSGKLFDKQGIANAEKRAKDFLADFPGIGVNSDGLKIFNQRIVLDVELLQYNVRKARNLGIKWPDAISASANFSYGWDLSRSQEEGAGSELQDVTTGSGESSVTTRKLVPSFLNKIERHNDWKMESDLKVDGVKVTVNLLKQNGVSKTLYKTSLATQSGEEAKFQNGGTIHRNTEGTFSGGDLKEIEYGFIIKALPKIIDDRMINLTVDLDNKQKPTDYEANSTKDIDIARYQTRSQYMVRPGETILVSGFNQIAEGQTRDGLPFLSHIPLIGPWLFGSSSTADDTEEIVLVVTVNWAVENETEMATKRMDELKAREAKVEMP